MQNWKCNNCQWQGTEEELEKDSVESCMGNDEVETCPKCGSYDVFPIRERPASQNKQEK